MVSGKRFAGHTLQLRVPDIEAGREFYLGLFGRAPDLSPHEDFHEWEISDGAWLQLGQGQPIPAYPARFGVSDIEEDCRQLHERLGVVCGEINRIPGLVAFCNFKDPWGNCLGFYQDLSDGEPVLPGGRESE